MRSHPGPQPHRLIAAKQPFRFVIHATQADNSMSRYYEYHSAMLLHCTFARNLQQSHPNLLWFMALNDSIREELLSVYVVGHKYSGTPLVWSLTSHKH